MSSGGRTDPGGSSRELSAILRKFLFLAVKNRLSETAVKPNPHITVAAVARQGERFLMVEEAPDGTARCLNQPAGHLEPGETPLQAVTRECLEETAWQFRPDALLGVYTWHNPLNGQTFVRIAFVGECTGQERGRALDPDILAVHWLTAAELRDPAARLRSPLVLRAVEDYLAGRRYPLELLVDLTV